MPIANAVYARYYAKKREELMAKMREKYDPEKKKAYYEKNADQMRAKMLERYYSQKAERNLTALNELLAKNPPDFVKVKIDDLLKDEKYKTANKRTLKNIEQQLASFAVKNNPST